MKSSKKKRLIDTSNLTPMIREGLTQDVSLEELKREEIREDAAKESVIQSMGRQDYVGRVPLPRFIAQDSDSELVITFPDGRRFRDIRKVFQPETLQAIREGMICLKCLEPQPSAFADVHLPGCEGVNLAGPAYMKRRQLLDLVMEFEGEVHIGPGKPMRDYLDELMLRSEMSEFDAKIASGKSPMKGLN